MNKSVFISMLTLSIGLLAGMYILKIFFPQEFLFVIENERIIAVGEYIDSHAWAYYMLGVITSFITYWLYLCAVCKRRALNINQCGIVLVAIAISIGLSFADEKLSNHFNIASMLLLPWIFKGGLKEVAIVYSVHGLAQVLSLEIRGLSMYIQYSNTLFFVLLTLEMYFWLFLFYIIFNYKKQEV